MSWENDWDISDSDHVKTNAVPENSKDLFRYFKIMYLIGFCMVASFVHATQYKEFSLVYNLFELGLREFNPDSYNKYMDEINSYFYKYTILFFILVSLLIFMIEKLILVSLGRKKYDKTVIIALILGSSCIILGFVGFLYIRTIKQTILKNG